MDEISISIGVAERSYRLVVKKEHEEFFRKAEKLIDKRMKDYSVSYAYKDKQDLLAMVALEYATSYLQDEQLLTEKEDMFENRLMEINRTLDEQLQY